MKQSKKTLDILASSTQAKSRNAFKKSTTNQERRAGVGSATLSKTGLKLPGFGLYKPQDWSLAAKIVIQKEVKWAIGSVEPLETVGPDCVYLFLLEKVIHIILEQSPNCSEPAWLWERHLTYVTNPESPRYRNLEERETSSIGTSDPSVKYISSKNVRITDK